MNLKKLFFPNKPAAALKLEDLTDRCDGCHWKAIGRFQKCTSCRRNAHLKDHYKPMVVNDDAPDVL